LCSPRPYSNLIHPFQELGKFDTHNFPAIRGRALLKLILQQIPQIIDLILDAFAVELQRPVFPASGEA
jgi:hypothetical protein